jgi:hypothetical protein
LPVNPVLGMVIYARLNRPISMTMQVIFILYIMAFIAALWQSVALNA